MIDDTTAPLITDGPSVSHITANSAHINWTTNENATTQVDYRKQGVANWSQYIDGTYVTSHIANITSIGATNQNITYEYRVKTIDAGGNTTTDSIKTFQTDGIPPVISSVTSQSIGQTSATIVWTTNEQATSQVEYGIDTSYGSLTTANLTLATNHSEPISGLQAHQTYHYHVISIDKAGNQSTSEDLTFTTSP